MSKNRALFGFGFFLLIALLSSCATTKQESSLIPEVPLSLIGRWERSEGNHILIINYYDDSTYFIKYDSMPVEIGIFSYTDSEITITPTYVFAASYVSEIPQPVYDAKTLYIDYEITGVQLIEKDYGVFIYKGLPLITSKTISDARANSPQILKDRDSLY